MEDSDNDEREISTAPMQSSGSNEENRFGSGLNIFNLKISIFLVNSLHFLLFPFFLNISNV